MNSHQGTSGLSAAHCRHRKQCARRESLIASRSRPRSRVWSSADGACWWFRWREQRRKLADLCGPRARTRSTRVGWLWCRRALPRSSRRPPFCLPRGSGAHVRPSGAHHDSLDAKGCSTVLVSAVSPLGAPPAATRGRTGCALVGNRGGAGGGGGREPSGRAGGVSSIAWDRAHCMRSGRGWGRGRCWDQVATQRQASPSARSQHRACREGWYVARHVATNGYDFPCWEPVQFSSCAFSGLNRLQPAS